MPKNSKKLHGLQGDLHGYLQGKSLAIIGGCRGCRVLRAPVRVTRAYHAHSINPHQHHLTSAHTGAPLQATQAMQAPVLAWLARLHGCAYTPATLANKRNMKGHAYVW